MKLKFYKCNHCGNMVAVVKDAGVPMTCCGEKMEELVAASVDAAVEKHVPEVQVEGNKVKVEVGSVAHPMEENHYIQWVAIETKLGMQMKQLNPGEEPKTCFTLCDNDELVSVYEYCNLHGLWKK